MESTFSKQLEEGEIIRYIGLWDNGTRVMTQMVGGSKGGEDTAPKQATILNVAHGFQFLCILWHMDSLLSSESVAR
jgi:hypothetical protein